MRSGRSGEQQHSSTLLDVPITVTIIIIITGQLRKGIVLIRIPGGNLPTRRCCCSPSRRMAGGAGFSFLTDFLAMRRASDRLLGRADVLVQISDGPEDIQVTSVAKGGHVTGAVSNWLE